MHAKATLKQCFYLICIVAAGCSSKRRSLPIPTLKHQKRYSNLSSITIASTGAHAVICIGSNNTIHMGTTAVALQPSKGTKPLDNSTPAGQPTLAPEGTTLTITSTDPYGMVLVGDANTIYRHIPMQPQQTTTVTAANNNSKNEQQPATANKSKSRKPQLATTGHNQPKTTEKAATSNQKPATKNSSLGATDQTAAHSNGPDPKQATEHTQADRTAHSASKNAKQIATNRLEKHRTRNLRKAKQYVPTNNGAKPRTRKDVEGLNNTFQAINKEIEKKLQESSSIKLDLQKVQNKLQPTLVKGKGKQKRGKLYDHAEKKINDLTKVEQELENIRTHLTEWIQKDTQNKDMEYLQEIEQKIGSKSMDPNNINVKNLIKTINKQINKYNNKN